LFGEAKEENKMKKQKMTVLFLAFSFCLICIVGCGNNPVVSKDAFEIKGKILDASGKPLADQVIYWEISEPLKQTLKLQTGSNGNYSASTKSQNYVSVGSTVSFKSGYVTYFCSISLKVGLNELQPVCLWDVTYPFEIQKIGTTVTANWGKPWEMDMLSNWDSTRDIRYFILGEGLPVLVGGGKDATGLAITNVIPPLKQGFLFAQVYKDIGDISINEWAAVTDTQNF